MQNKYQGVMLYIDRKLRSACICGFIYNCRCEQTNHADNRQVNKRICHGEETIV